MSTLEAALREAMALHRSSQFDQAHERYQAILARHPGHPKALYYLALLEFHRGHGAAAIALLQECLKHAPDHGIAWNTLGSMLAAQERRSDALAAWRRATIAAPQLGEAWYNVGVCLGNQGDSDGAVAQFRSGIAQQPQYSRNHEALATLLYRLGRIDQAASAYLDWLRCDPHNPVAQHMAAAARRDVTPERASDDFVRSLFDAAAHRFDADLERLNYQAPQRLARRLAEQRGAQPLGAVLDAGCGTGLCGALLRPQCQRLSGVDLSARMIEQAKLRACYDELEIAELCTFMRSRSHAFDAIVAADTLVYFGALSGVLEAARTALRPKGLLLFTLEALDSQAGLEHRLELHGRYAHAEPYVRRALAAAAFDILSFEPAGLREERGVGVAGYLVCASSHSSTAEYH